MYMLRVLHEGHMVDSFMLANCVLPSLNTVYK